MFPGRKSDGPSRVSDNGQVVFLYEASADTYRELMDRTFEMRLARVVNEAG